MLGKEQQVEASKLWAAYRKEGSRADDQQQQQQQQQQVTGSLSGSTASTQSFSSNTTTTTNNNNNNSSQHNSDMGRTRKVTPTNGSTSGGKATAGNAPKYYCRACMELFPNWSQCLSHVRSSEAENDPELHELTTTPAGRRELQRVSKFTPGVSTPTPTPTAATPPATPRGTARTPTPTSSSSWPADERPPSAKPHDANQPVAPPGLWSRAPAADEEGVVVPKPERGLDNEVVAVPPGVELVRHTPPLRQTHQSQKPQPESSRTLPQTQAAPTQMPHASGMETPTLPASIMPGSVLSGSVTTKPARLSAFSATLPAVRPANVSTTGLQVQAQMAPHQHQHQHQHQQNYFSLFVKAESPADGARPASFAAVPSPLSVLSTEQGDDYNSVSSFSTMSVSPDTTPQSSPLAVTDRLFEFSEASPRAGPPGFGTSGGSAPKKGPLPVGLSPGLGTPSAFAAPSVALVLNNSSAASNKKREPVRAKREPALFLGPPPPGFRPPVARNKMNADVRPQALVPATPPQQRLPAPTRMMTTGAAMSQTRRDDPAQRRPGFVNLATQLPDAAAVLVCEFTSLEDCASLARAFLLVSGSKAAHTCK